MNGTTSYTQEGDYSGNYSNDIVDVKAEVSDKEVSPYYTTATLKAGTFYVSSKANDNSPATQITLEDAGSGQYYVKNANGEYIYPSASWESFLFWGNWNYSLGKGKQAVNVKAQSDGSIIIAKKYTSGSETTTAYLKVGKTAVTYIFIIRLHLYQRNRQQ